MEEIEKVIEAKLEKTKADKFVIMIAAAAVSWATSEAIEFVYKKLIIERRLHKIILPIE